MKPNVIVSYGGKAQFAIPLFFFLLFCCTPSFSQCWKQVAPTVSHSLALKEDGTLWLWGNNSSGQLGISTPLFFTQRTPTPLGTATDWAYISAGSSYSLAIKTNGTLWAWGNNSFGQLGIGNTTNQSSPVQVGSATNWARVWAASDAGGATIGLKTDGTLWSWGRNDLGQLGIGNTTQQNSPVQVGTDADWKSAIIGSSHVLAIKTNGTLWSWGNNPYGQLGIGNTTQQNSPVQVGADADWASVEVGQSMSVAMKNNRTLWTWGANGNGQLGQGNTNNQSVPVQIGTDADWAMAVAGASHMLAVKTNGTLWSWGYNNIGQLGNGTTTDGLAPAQVGTDNDWIAVSPAQMTSMAIKANKTIWGWGANNTSQIGINNSIAQSTPVQTGFTTYPATLPALTGGGAATLTTSCEPDIFGYYSYLHPTAITRKLLAIHPNGNTGSFTVVYDTSRNTNSTPLLQSNANNATSIMGRLVTVSYSGTLGAGVRVRFYYSAADSTNTSNALDSWISAHSGAVKQWQWVKYEGDAAAMAAGQSANGFSGTFVKLTPDSSGVENSVSFVEFRNITSFSTFGAVAFANTTNAPLPVTLHDLTVTLQQHCSGVKLDWTTGMEQNSKDFTIQRSTDGKGWNSIGVVLAAGNSGVQKNYSYTDNSIGGQAIYFYRLQLTDRDGLSKYSRIVSVRSDCSKSDGYLVYPNPVKHFITIQSPAGNGRKVIAVYNDIGVCMVRLTLTSGTTQTTIPAHGWSKGLYMVIIKENDKVMRTEKLIKQ
jgi:alpha-tubulin suppressor-like RCC1 family protein